MSESTQPKRLKDLKELPNKANTNIKNALFVGSTNELQKMLNNNKGEKIVNVKPTKETD